MALLSDALSNLTPQQREIFQLKEKDNLTLESIAKLKKITRQAVQQHYHAAMKKLRDFYSQYPFFLEFFPTLEGGGAKWSSIKDSSIKVFNHFNRIYLCEKKNKTFIDLLAFINLTLSIEELEKYNSKVFDKIN